MIIEMKQGTTPNDIQYIKFQIDEWLNAAKYMVSEGNEKVILCERGVRTYETATRNTLDISTIPVIKSKRHLPIIVDPSHAAGKHNYISTIIATASSRTLSCI